MTREPTTRLQRLLASDTAIVLDGGVGTYLERFHPELDLSTPLWSAMSLLSSEGIRALRSLHRAYLDAGAHIVTTATYQASELGTRALGSSEPKEQARTMLANGLRVAVETRDAWCAEHGVNADARPLVAFSLGSYGAARADHSEYTGDFGADTQLETLAAFHANRLGALAQCALHEPALLHGLDALAFETLPSLLETQAVVDALHHAHTAYPGVLPDAWVSYACRDGQHVGSGERLSACASVAAASSYVVAVGVNCTSPCYVPSLLGELTRNAQLDGKAIVCYPNGQAWCTHGNTWNANEIAEPLEFAGMSEAWARAGARVVGGCCRTTPDHIAAVRKRLHVARLTK